MRRRSGWLALGLSLVGFGAERQALADTLGVDAPVPSPPATGGTETSVVARYWELAAPRAFLAANVEAGVGYLRPRFVAGYGRPHWSWLGVEAHPSAGFDGLGYYTGLSASLPYFSLRAGSRYFHPFSRSLLTPRAHFTRTDISLLSGPLGDYVAHELEATGTAPLGHGSAFAVLTGMVTSLVPDGYYLYEESLKVVMAPPYVWRARAGYLLAFGERSALRVGGALEVIGLPARDRMVLRAGLLASLLLSARLEAQASFIPVLVSPDSLGLAGSDFGQLGIRYRWAWPEREIDAK